MSKSDMGRFAVAVALGVGLSFAGRCAQPHAATTTKPRSTTTVRKPVAPVKKVPVVQAKPIVTMSTKIVPIFSLGQGNRVGVAQVTGPSARVKEVLVVGQLETVVMDVARVRIFIPVKTQGGFDRVPQADVNAYADLKL